MKKSNMKYLKHYKIFENKEILDYIKDILIELEDAGYYVNIKRPDVISKEGKDWIMITIEKHPTSNLNHRRGFYINNDFKHPLEHLKNYIEEFGYAIKYIIDDGIRVDETYFTISSLLKREFQVATLKISLFK